MRLLWLSALGLAFLCLPAAASEESDPCAPGQLLGHWFVLGIGSNCEWMVQFMTKEIMTANISGQEEGNFTVTTNFLTDYGPMDMEMTYTKQENGIYLYKSEWGDKVIEGRKTDCKTYVMTCVKDVKENDGKFCKFVSFYAAERNRHPACGATLGFFFQPSPSWAVTGPRLVMCPSGQGNVCVSIPVAGLLRLRYGHAGRQRADIPLGQERCHCKIH